MTNSIARYMTVSLSEIRREPMPAHAGIPALLTRLGLASQTQECFWVISYDAVMEIRTVVEIARGNYSRVTVHPPAVFSAVLLAGADRFMVAHNHPSGPLRPTESDVVLTNTLMAGANALGLFFEDHWIVSPAGRGYSFTANKLLLPAPYSGGTGEEAANR